ncbi:AsmA-like C-terminal region-containing protein [Solidesulfovibrio carbinoliphilus]|uniref:AsmA family protein n=1 Tax=Solidesulfovibrio carbinoliphilus TaxID=345370 RepID=UPI000315D634|nr:AsmA-like C-terminal region-containing protein [Solidesulfovibrio carbinoliphilus]
MAAVLAVGVLPFAARQMIGPERLKTITEQALTDALGRRVTVSGDVSILFAPWFGLAMGPVAVAERPGAGDGPMLTAGRLEMTIRVLPLLARVVSPGSVRVRDLGLHLRRDASGRTNWDDLTAPHSAAAASAPDWEVAPEPRDILIENASVDYRDAVTGRVLAVTDARLKTGLGQPFDFSLAFRAAGLLPDTSLECHARGKATFDPGSGRLAFSKTVVESALTILGPLAPGGATPARLVSRLTADYDPAAGTLSLAGLDVRLPGGRITGSAEATGLGQSPKVRAALALDLDMAGKWRELLGLSPAAGPGNLVAAPAGAPEKTVGPVPTEGLSIGPAAAVPAGHELASLALTAEADASGLRLEDLTLRLPRGRVAATGSFSAGDAPVLEAAIAAEDVDFDALPRPAGRPAWPWPAPWLTSLAGAADLDARLDLRRCRLAGQAVADAHATLRGHEGLFRLYPVSVVLPGGLVSLDARLDAGPEPGPGPLADSLAARPADSLGLDVRAVIEPARGAGEPASPPSRARLLGRLHADQAQGTLLVQAPDPARAAAVLGLSGPGLPAVPLEAKGAFHVTPGAGSLVAKAAVTGLEAKVGTTALRGQIGYDAATAGLVTFDCATDTVDLDRLGAVTAGAGAAAGGGTPFRAEGKVRAERVLLRGLEAKNVALALALGAGKAEGTVTGAELFGGRLTGRIEADPTGRLVAALQLAGAEAARLSAQFPGNGPGLAGPVTAKATLEAPGDGKGRPGPVTATVEAEAAQLVHGNGGHGGHGGNGGKRQVLASPKLVLAVKGREGGDGGDAFDGDASLALTLGAGFGLRDIKLTAAGPLALDKAGRLREPGPAKVEASALWRASDAGRTIKLGLTGPVSPDAAGGFATGDLRLDAGGLPATVRLSRKAADGAPVAFSLETGPLAPRRVLADWGVALPRDLPADRLAKAALSVSGTATGEALDVKRLAVTLDGASLTGSGTVPGFDPRRGKWELAVDRLDFDAYFPRPPASGTPSLVERRKPLDLQLLRELALEAKINVGWLKKGNVVFDAATITANARGGQFTFRQESPRFYGGRFSVEMRGDARDTAVKTLIELKLESIEIARFLWDWAEGNTLDSGSGTFILAARTSGGSEEELRGNLAGNASLQITRGSLKVREPAGRPGEEPTYDKLPFDVFSSSWLARGGVAHSEDFLIESPRMRVTGKGFVDLRDESINLSLLAALAGGGQLPATIIGPLDGPKLSIDRSKLIGDMVYRVLQGIVSIPGKAVTRILQLR